MRVILIDVSNLAHRFWHTMKVPCTKCVGIRGNVQCVFCGNTKRMQMANSKGHPTGVLHGVMSHLITLNRESPDSALVFCWDSKSNWRFGIKGTVAEGYKSNRGPISAKSDLHKQLDILRKMLDLLGFKSLYVESLEADDIVGIASKILTDSGHKVRIYSGDRDFIQLVDENVKLLQPSNDGPREVDIRTVKKVYGIRPSQWAKMRALSGDSSDKMKPLSGVAMKTAIKMLKYGVMPGKSFDAQPRKVQKKYKKHKADWNNVKVCYRLTKLPRDVKFRYFPAEARKELAKVFKGLGSNPARDAFSDRRKEKNKIKLKAIFKTYELVYVLSKRKLLWRFK